MWRDLLSSEKGEKKTKGRNTGSNSCIVIQSASTFRREMKSSTLYLTLFLIIFFVLVVNIDAAAVGKGGGVGGGGRSAKGMRRKSGGRKQSAGTGNALLKPGLRPGGKDEKETHQKESGSGISPLGSRMTEESEAYYNNQNGARIVDASHFESEYILGRKLAFYCKAQGIPRPEITWLKDGIELYSNPFFQVHEFKVGKNQINSKMEIDPTTQRDSGYYECQADNKYAIDKRGFRTDFTLDVY